MSDVNMRVQAATGGWWVDCDLPLEAMYFRSGARAEAVAREIAIHLSGVGHDVFLEIRDRSEQPVATHRYFAI